MTTAADVVVEGLVRQGVRHLFGMPGSHSTTLYDALARNGSIGTILIRNEQAGAFAADGYARVGGRPGVICTTAGPGATNALTGIAEAWADSIPMLLLGGQVNADRIDQECGAYHEVDLEGIFRPVTKWCRTVREVEAIPTLIRDAFRALEEDRPRPAALFLPQDLMRHETTWKEPPAPPLEPRSPLPADAIVSAAALLGNASRPIVLAGGGALWGNAGAEVVAVAERLHAPLITSLNAKGLLDERDPRSLGHARSARARAALPHADAMLAVGCRFTEVMTDWRRMPVPANLVQIDLDPAQIGMNHPVAVGIVADARSALRSLLDHLPEHPRLTTGSGWAELWESARLARPERPEWLIDTLRDELPPDTPLFCDACELGFRLQADWISRGPRLFFYPSNYITLGWGFPAALGAAVALGDRPDVSLSGDGGFLMCSQELATAARYRLRVIALVHNDSTFGAIKNIQKRDNGARYLDVDLNNPDFLALAAAYGLPSHRVRAPEELRRALRIALENPGPSLIEVPDPWRMIRE
jgi:acetolactate synthase-1/2/3 large subunit